MKDIRQQWKALASEKKITAIDVAALCVYRALLDTEADAKATATALLLKAFAPVTNQIKLDNGATPRYSMLSALRLVKYSKVYEWLPEENRNDLAALALELSRSKFE